MRSEIFLTISPCTQSMNYSALLRLLLPFAFFFSCLNASAQPYKSFKLFEHLSHKFPAFNGLNYKTKTQVVEDAIRRAGPSEDPKVLTDAAFDVIFYIYQTGRYQESRQLVERLLVDMQGEYKHLEEVKKECTRLFIEILTVKAIHAISVILFYSIPVYLGLAH